MMVMAAALAKLIFARVMMTSKFWWWVTTWQSDDWFQMQCTVKRGHLMAMNLPKRGTFRWGLEASAAKSACGLTQDPYRRPSWRPIHTRRVVGRGMSRGKGATRRRCPHARHYQ